MRKLLAIALLLVTAVLVYQPSHALAQDFARKKLGQWGDPLTPPPTRLRCVKEASMTGFKCRGLKCSRNTWKTCIGTAMDTRTMQCEAFLRVPRVEALPNTLKKAAVNAPLTPTAALLKSDR
jgi:hypothetical protein